MSKPKPLNSNSALIVNKAKTHATEFHVTKIEEELNQQCVLVALVHLTLVRPCGISANYERNPK